MRLKSIDQILLVLLFFVGTVSTVMLFRRDNPKGNVESIAVIISEINTVKRKASLFDSWRELSLGDTLQENDQVYTHDRSEVELQFKSGKKIQLLENSLLKISRDDKQESLILEKGILEARFNQEKNNQPLKVDFKGKSVLLDSNTGVVQVESSDEGAKIFVQSGELNISDGKNSVTIKENQSISQSKTGELGKVVDNFFILASPKNKMNFIKRSGTSGIPVRFQWKKNVNISPEVVRDYDHELLISKKFNFKNAYQVIKLDSDKNELVLDFFESGKFFWKIQSSNPNSGDIVSSGISSFEVQSASSSYITNTQNIYVKKKSFTNAESGLRVNWKNPMLPMTLKQKIVLKYNNVIISSVELDKKIQTYNYFFEKELKNIGSYSILLESEIEDHNKDSFWLQSGAYDFNVIEDQIPEIKVKNPKKETIFSYKRQGVQKLLSWEIESGVGAYEVSLLKNNKEVFKTITTDSFIDLPLFEEGVYQWKLRPMDSQGRKDREYFGEVILKFPKKLNSLPKSGEVLYLETPNQEVQFKWEKSSRAESFIFELSENPDFQTITHSSDTAKSYYSTRLGKTGNFYWRVKMKIGDQVEYSEPVSVEVKPAPLIEKPIIEEEIKLQLQKMDTSFFKNVPGVFIIRLVGKIIRELQAQNEVNYKVEWNLKTFKNVKSYIVEIYRDNELNELLLKEEVAIPKFIWKKAIAGTFYWRLAYRDQWDRVTEFSNLSKLVIEPMAIANVESTMTSDPEVSFESIELISPKHRDQIRAPQRSSVSFLGLSDGKKEKKPEFELLLSKDLDFKEIIFKKKISSVENKLMVEISCDEFSKFLLFDQDVNEFYWRMRNSTSKVESKRRFVSLYLNEICPSFFVEKNDKAEKVLDLVKEEERKDIFKYQDRYTLGLNPTSISLKSRGNGYDAKASGVSFLGGSGFGEKFLNHNQDLNSFGMHSVYGKLNFVSGKIFNSENLKNINIEAGSRVLHYLKLGVGLRNQTELVEVKQSSITAKNKMLYGLATTLEYETLSFLSSLTLQFGNYLSYEIQLEKDFVLVSLPLSLGVSFQNLSFKTNAKENHQIQTDQRKISLNLNYRFK